MAALVAYDLATSYGMEYVAAAYWPVAPGVWLQGAGTACSAAERADLLHTLRSLRFTAAR